MYLECSLFGNELHSHTYYDNTHLFKNFIANFIADSPQTESKQKDDFVRHKGVYTHPKKVTFLTMAYIRTTFPTMAYIVRHECIDTHVQKLRRQRMRSFPCAKSYTISDERIDTHVQKSRTPQRH